MTVKQGKDYMDEAVKRFFEASRYAKKMGVSEEHIVQMKPSLTTRSSKSTNTNTQDPKHQKHICSVIIDIINYFNKDIYTETWKLQEIVAIVLSQTIR